MNLSTAGIQLGAGNGAHWVGAGAKPLLLVVEFAGGIVFGSLALIARPISIRHSFGFARAEVMAAQISALLLVGAGSWIVYEGSTRVLHPRPVDGAGLAAVGHRRPHRIGHRRPHRNLGSALVHRAQGESLNMRASFVHLATDTAGSVGAIIAGLLTLGSGWLRADPILSMATAVPCWCCGQPEGFCVTLCTSPMEGAPRGIDTTRVRAGARGHTVRRQRR
ncbi:MAG: cation transporter [Actinomycetota bacterium]|nr:cation transporter [Actinomycetota bacterium]